MYTYMYVCIILYIILCVYIYIYTYRQLITWRLPFEGWVCNRGDRKRGLQPTEISASLLEARVAKARTERSRIRASGWARATPAGRDQFGRSAPTVKPLPTAK